MTKIAPQAPKHQDFGQIRHVSTTALDFAYAYSPRRPWRDARSYSRPPGGLCYALLTWVGHSQVTPHRVLALFLCLQFDAVGCLGFVEVGQPLFLSFPTHSVESGEVYRRKELIVVRQEFVSVLYVPKNPLVQSTIFRRLVSIGLFVHELVAVSPDGGYPLIPY